MSESAAPRAPLVRRRRWPFVLTGLALAVVAGVIIRGVTTSEEAAGPSRITDAVDLVHPDPLTPGEQDHAAQGLDPQASVRLDAGAWVEVADPRTGRLAQRYSAAKVAPLPDRHVQMGQPVASFHAENGRIVTVRGDRAVAHVPRQALESGTIEGNVVVKLFRPDATGRVDLERDSPAVEVHADAADFDGPLGQLRCDERVEVLTPALRFLGRGLTMLLSASGDAPERLVVDEALEPIQIDLLEVHRRQAPDPGVPAVAQASPAAPATASNAAPTAPGAGPASQSAAAAPGSGAPGAKDDHRFYRLTLHDNVLVERRRDGVPSTIEGDSLSIVFSMDGQETRKALAAASTEFEPAASLRQVLPALALGDPATSAPTPPPSMSLVSHIVASAFAAADEAAQPATDLLFITYTGRLVMTPATDPEDILASPDDVRIEIAGAPVVLRDPEKELVGRCRMLRYDAEAGRLELRGDDLMDLEVVTPRLALQADALWLERSTGIGRIEGAGRMEIDERSSAARHRLNGVVDVAVASHGDCDALVAAILAILQDDRQDPAGQGGATGAAAGAAAGAAGSPPPTRELPLEITWQDGVDLAFAPDPDGGEGGSLREARFVGDVRVAGEDFALRSDKLRVAFEPAEPGAAPDVRPGEAPEGRMAESISEIEATGEVRVMQLGQTGEMEAESLLLTMTRGGEGAEGRSVPERLVATGDVSARDAARHILSQALTVTFRPRTPEEQAAAEAKARTADGRTPGVAQRMGTVEIGAVLAERDVRVELEDGARVYADRLDGDSLAGTLNLTGDEVVIARDRFVADRLRDVRFDDQTRTVHAPGPGRFRYFADPVALPPVQTPGRPAFPQTPELEALWTGAMHYDDRASAGSGSIQLSGDVNVRSEPSREEIDTVRARELTLDLKPGRAPSGGAAAAPAGSGGSDRRGLAAPGQSSRELARLTATGDAEIEARRWPDGDRSALPAQLFRVRGPKVVYDLRTREAQVEGAGQILVHDTTPGDDGGKSSLGSRGSATFGWNGRMEMRREGGDQYVIVMSDQVELLHAGIRAEDQLTLTCDRLEVTVDRPAAGGGGEGERQDAVGGVDLGGDAEILRIRAVGRVFIRTPEQDVECHEFDYNARTGIAQIRARPGRQVLVQMKTVVAPLRAESMVWDMREGRIQILGGTGAVGK